MDAHSKEATGFYTIWIVGRVRKVPHSPSSIENDEGKKKKMPRKPKVIERTSNAEV